MLRPRHGLLLGVLTLAAALTLAAIAGKQLCAAGVLEKGVSRLAVGIGMVPRGEVELIMANIGLTLTVAGRPVIDQGDLTILSCLQENRPKLTSACDQVLKSHGQ